MSEILGLLLDAVHCFLVYSPPFVLLWPEHCKHSLVDFASHPRAQGLESGPLPFSRTGSLFFCLGSQPTVNRRWSSVNTKHYRFNVNPVGLTTRHCVASYF